MSLKNSLSSQIHYQLPDFVKENYDTFSSFMQAYFEWMDTEPNVADFVQNIQKNQDIDTTLESLLSFFEFEFLSRIPNNILTDKRTLIKNVREFYRARGTEKSYEFFFRILFDQDIDFFYPHQFLFKASDGVWTFNEGIRVSSVVGDPFSWVKKDIKGIESNATAQIDSVTCLQLGNQTVYNLIFGRGTRNGTFNSDEVILDENDNVLASIVPILKEIEITDGGSGYDIGTPVTITSSIGVGAIAQVSTVEPKTKKIIKISVLDQGAHYYQDPTITIPTPTDLTVDSPAQANATAVIGGLYTSPGYYIGNKGQVSSTMRIQDSFYWQQFSYVLKVSESFDQYRELVKRNLHPSGLKLFGSFSPLYIEKTGSHKGGLGDQGFDHHLELQTLFSVSSKIVDVTITRSISLLAEEHSEAFKIGPTVASLERDKFTYAPTSNNYENEFMYGPNRDYYRVGANTPSEHFDHITIEDARLRPFKKINITPEAYLINTLNDGKALAVPKEFPLWFTINPVIVTTS